VIDPELLHQPDKYHSLGFLKQPWDKLWAIGPEKRFNPDQERDEHGRWSGELSSSIEAALVSLPNAKVFPNLEAAQTAKSADEDGSAWLLPSGKALGLTPGGTHENVLMLAPAFKEAFWAAKPHGIGQITQFATELGFVRVGGPDSFEFGKINSDQLAQLEGSFFRSAKYADAAHVDVWVKDNLLSVTVEKDVIAEKGLGPATRDAIKKRYGQDPMPSLPYALRALEEASELRFSVDQARDESGKWTDGGTAPSGKPWTETFQGLLPEAQQEAQKKMAMFMPHLAVREARAGAELKADEKEALAGYQRDSTGLNNFLRSGANPAANPDDYRYQNPASAARARQAYEKQAATLDETIKSKGLEYKNERPVWRGVDGQSFTGRHSGFAKLVGSVIEDKGFLSTTPSGRSASKFGTIDLRLTIPPGSRYVELTGEREGTEYLFGRDSKLRIDAYYPRDDVGNRAAMYATLLT